MTWWLPSQIRLPFRLCRRRETCWQGAVCKRWPFPSSLTEMLLMILPVWHQSSFPGNPCRFAWIRVHSSLAAGLKFVVIVVFIFSSLPVFSAAPANDKFINRITLTGTNITTSGSNVGANKESGEPDHAGNIGGKSIWWSWTAPTNGEVVITTDGSTNGDAMVDTVLAVYTGSAVTALSLVASNDDHGVFVTSKVRFQAIKGTNYQIAVDGYNDGTPGATADSGNIMLNLVFISEPILRPPNDNFTNRIGLSGGSVTANGSNVEATREPGEPLHAEKLGDTSVWWQWTADRK